MKNNYFIFFILISILGFSQNKKKLEVASNIEGRGLVMKAIGNNVFSKDMGVFYGAGVGGQLMTPIRFGVGIDYNLLFGDLKPGHEQMFGNLGSQKLTQISFNIIHKDFVSEDLHLEESIGFSIYRFSSYLIPEKEKYIQGNGGYNLGLNLVYTLDREGYQQFVFGAKGNGYFANIHNENKDIKKYYSRTIFAGLTFGYRYNF